jgi:hypothetical protein
LPINFNAGISALRFEPICPLALSPSENSYRAAGAGDRIGF